MSPNLLHSRAKISRDPLENIRDRIFARVSHPWPEYARTHIGQRHRPPSNNSFDRTFPRTEHAKTAITRTVWIEDSFALHSKPKHTNTRSAKLPKPRWRRSVGTPLNMSTMNSNSSTPSSPVPHSSQSALTRTHQSTAVSSILCTD